MMQALVTLQPLHAAQAKRTDARPGMSLQQMLAADASTAWQPSYWHTHLQ